MAYVAGSAADVLGQKIPEIQIAQSDSYKESTTIQQSSSLNADGNLVLAASDSIHTYGADIGAGGNAILSANDISLDAVAETHSEETSHSEETAQALGSKLGDGELRVSGYQENKYTETTTTTQTAYKGTNLSGGNVALLSTNNIDILSSTIKAEGQAIVQADGDVNISGYQDKTETKHESITETTTTSIGVRNAYVDAGMAAKALVDAAKAVDDAKTAYDKAKKRVDDGELAKAALKEYEQNLEAATANLAQAEIAAAAAIAGAAGAAGTSMGTGFYVSGSAQTTTTSTTTTQTASLWQGSQIEAGALSISSQNATIEGSDITAGSLFLNSDNVLITAGINQYQQTTQSSTKSAGGSGGSNGSGSVNASTSTSQSSSSSLENVNSRISVGYLESDADSFTLRGAEVTAQTANLDVGSLTIQSLQDTSESSNSSHGTNVGASYGQSKTGNSQSVSLGYNESSGQGNSNEVGNQTMLLITDGANSQITAKDTTIIGGVIANAERNEDGSLTDLGNLNLTTETLTVQNLQDSSKSEQSGSGFQVSTGRSDQTDPNTKQQSVSYGNSGTTTVSASHTGHETEGLTNATIGLGNVTVGGKALEETNPEVNRDLAQAQVTTKDQDTGGLNISVTADNRWLTSDGRNSLLSDQEHLAENSERVAVGALTDAIRVAAAGTNLVSDPSQVANAWSMVGKGQELAYADGGRLAGEIENIEDGSTRDAQATQDTLNEVGQLMSGNTEDHVKVTQGTDAYGAYNESDGTIYVDQGLGGSDDRTESVVNTMAHEEMHAQGANEASATVTGYLTDWAYSANAWANSDAIAANRPAGVPVQNEVANDLLLMENNAAFHEAASKDELDYRQLKSGDRELAEELAIKSEGKYTVEQIEDALRNSSNKETGESVATGMIVKDPANTYELYDPGAKWSMGSEGLLVQVLPNNGQVDPMLAAFIQNETGGGQASPYEWSSTSLGAVPDIQTNLNSGNTITPAANGCVTAECMGALTPVRNPVRDGQDVRNDVADGAALVSRGAGIVESTATAAAIPGPHQPEAVSLATGAMIVGGAADLVEQAARPNLNQVVVDQFIIGRPEDILSSKFPLYAPVINEAAEVLKKSFPSDKGE